MSVLQLHKLLVGSDLDDLSIIEDHNLVGVLDCAESMSDDDDLEKRPDCDPSFDLLGSQFTECLDSPYGL